MPATLTIQIDNTPVFFFKPTDMETFYEYFDIDAPERSLTFFVANHAEQVGEGEEFGSPPQVGDFVFVGGEEMIVRARYYSGADEKNNGRRHLIALVVPLYEEEEAAKNAS